MISRPYPNDFRLISNQIGKVLCGISLLYSIPCVTAVACGEWDQIPDYLISFNACFIAGLIFIFFGIGATGRMRWVHSMVVAAFSWFIADPLCAMPHYLSGHFASYFDAMFDVMSGFTTTGLILILDLDHISHSLNMWRHLLTYVGGQGMIVLVLAFLVRGTAGAYMMYVGEGKDEKLLPNVIHTTRAIWIISTVYLFLGTAVLLFVLEYEGIAFPRSLLHALWLFMGAWSTGGFAPQSQSILYYHSVYVELVTLVIMILGSFNFVLHYAVWSGNPREMFKNIEIRAFTVTASLTFAILACALIRSGVYADLVTVLRRGSYLLISGHTTTGYMQVYANQIIQDWGELATVAIIVAMAFGASACSTGGGFKGLRTGIVAKGLYHEIKRIMLSEDAYFLTKFHHIKDIILTETHVKMAGLIIICYVAIHLIGALIGSLFGYPFVNALFECVSAGSNTGLSCGVTAPAMPALLKGYYIFAMWAGRLEFISLFGLIAFGISILRGK
ncbi:MAG: TrkH family potassium uptake protein [Candidatus Aureabacteria bacterium]|nr:TrkH family potassium uptake protein [Candidatus Auribacterota bacterium]